MRVSLLVRDTAPSAGQAQQAPTSTEPAALAGFPLVARACRHWVAVYSAVRPSAAQPVCGQIH
eukprot:667420-Alexandrium_andersonii.AAC.1